MVRTHSQQVKLWKIRLVSQAGEARQTGACREDMQKPHDEDKEQAREAQCTAPLWMEACQILGLQNAYGREKRER
jgi:hypothetical protein